MPSVEALSTTSTRSGAPGLAEDRAQGLGQQVTTVPGDDDRDDPLLVRLVDPASPRLLGHPLSAAYRQQLLVRSDVSLAA